MSVTFQKNVDTQVTAVTRMRFGAGWDRKTVKPTGWKAALGLKAREQAVDLDEALVLLRDGDPKRIVIGHNTDPVNGAAVHSGDNTTGEGTGDDESIDLDLSRLPAWVTEWAVVVTAFKPGTSFDNAQNVSINVYDMSSGRPELVDELMPTLGTRFNAVLVASGKRNRNADGAPVDGWSTRLVDHAGRLSAQGDDSALLAFVRQHAGL